MKYVCIYYKICILSYFSFSEIFRYSCSFWPPPPTLILFHSHGPRDVLQPQYKPSRPQTLNPTSPTLEPIRESSRPLHLFSDPPSLRLQLVLPLYFLGTLVYSRPTSFINTPSIFRVRGRDFLYPSPSSSPGQVSTACRNKRRCPYGRHLLIWTRNIWTEENC